MTTVAPIASSPRHPWETLLAQLTGLSKLAHGWGDETDAKKPSIDSIVWVAGAPRFEPRTFGIPGSDVVNLLVVPHTVNVYGGSPAVALQRVADLAGQLDLLAGPPKGTPDTDPPRPGYGFAPGKPIKGGEVATGAWLVPITVELRAFVLRQVYGSHVVASVPITVTAEGFDGAPEQGPPGASRPVP